MTMLPYPILVINTAMCAVNVTTVRLIEVIIYIFDIVYFFFLSASHVKKTKATMN